MQRSIDEWLFLNDVDLKKDIRQRIMGFGMGGSSAHHVFIEEYRKKIKSSDTQKRVDAILLELIDDSTGAGDRALYISTDLRLVNLKEKILKSIKKAEQSLETVQRALHAEEWGILIQYLLQFNTTIYQLDLKEARDFIVKQLGPLHGPQPAPGPNKEYYLYYLAQNALGVLKKIDPELARNYR